MSDLIDPGTARERSVRQAFEDGVEEIYVGLFSLVMGAVYLASFTLPRGSTVAQVSAFATSGIQFALLLALVAARKKVKAAYVFPRTGYVVFRPGKWRTWVILVFGMGGLAIALAFIVWRSRLPDLSRVAGPIAALGMAVCFLWTSVTYKFPHLSWLAAFSLLLGGLTYVMGAKNEGIAWVMLGIGAALALSGALRFRSFLKTRPIIQANPIGEGLHD
jgi:hypothetical protein